MFKAINAVLVGMVMMIGAGCSSIGIMKEELHVGVTPNFPPLVSEIDGDLQGLEIDLLNEVANKTGHRIIYKKYAFKDLKKALDTGEVDMVIGGITANKHRESMVSFTEPMISSGLMHIVRKDMYPEYVIPEVLQRKHGLRIGVERFTTGDRYSVKRFGNAHIVRYDSAEDALLALKHNDIDIVIHDAPTSWTCNDPALVPTYVALTNESYAWAYKPGNDKAFVDINNEIAALVKDPRYNEIWKRWIPERTVISYGNSYN